ncbi:hypothetical protein AQ490_20195 [Wenjunlia vitaminophila]|uniref:Uncharacterized protein n=1 Tax=Wenjunlia vitaminophila TaxID=76728 RepID=A0A0T6LU71_WENVI|nr:DUF6343 family protein [Wenjunlia vitaminophila]KRV49637.1 hypothetical protein AQ490_20195 [Wenjunlia vitaminophila]
MNRPRNDQDERRSGREPRHARSALGLRLALSVIFTPLFAAAALGFAWAAADASDEHLARYTVPAVAFGVLTVISLVDLVVVTHRWRTARRRRVR